MPKSLRYTRQIELPEIGATGQQKLLQTQVLVIGAGGLGCPVLQQLAVAGVGHIGIVDGDCIDETNLHRQILYTLADCGKSKAEIAASVLNRLNSDCEIVVFNEYFTNENANRITGNYHIIVDCTDTIQARYLINDIALIKKIPVVYASIHKFEGQVAVFNYKNGPSYRCLFPEKESKKSIPNCVTSGVLGVLPNTLGMLQATEVFKIILNIGEVLSGKVLLYNALTSQIQTVTFPKNEKAISIGKNKGNEIAHIVEEGIHLDADAFYNKIKQSESTLIDVRELNELPKLSFDNCLQIPLSKLEKAIHQLNPHQELIICCQSGKRSLFALELLKQKGFSKVTHLKNGIKNLEL